MISTLHTLLKIRSSSAVNLFFYYVQRFPLIGRVVKPTAYANVELKLAITNIVLILMLVWSVASKLLYLFLLVFLPVTMLHETIPAEDLELFTHIFFMISFVVAGVSSCNVLEPKRERYVAVKLMRMSPGRYMHAFLSYRYVVFFVSYLPALMIFVWLLEGTWVQAALLAVAAAMWRIICEYIHLKLFEKTGIVLVKKVALVWLVIAVGYAAAYLPLWLDDAPLTSSLLQHWLPPVIMMVLGGWAAIRLAKYRHYREAVEASTKRDDPYLNVGAMMADAQKASIQTKDQDYEESTQQQDKLQSKQGYAYLNAIFFARHRSLIRTPVYKRMAIVAALGILGAVAMVFLKDRMDSIQLAPSAFFPFLAVVFSSITVGEKICRAMFYHCDLALTRHSFYRSAAFEHFGIRLRQIVGHNLLIALVIGAALSMVTLIVDVDHLTMEFALMWLNVISLSIFFSIHHVFLYYIFQPYSTELNVKNPFYFVFTMVVSAACGLAIFLPIAPSVFTAIVVSLTVVYFVIALFMVRRYGHRTFRVK